MPPLPSPQLTALAQPFPKEQVHQNPSGGGTYAKQSTYNQKILLNLKSTFDFRITEIVRGDVPAIPPNPKGNSDRAKNGAPALSGVVVGALCTLQAEVDGRPTTITEVGEVEDPHNWKHDGQRLKDAASDGLKRCAARIGVGLHLRDEGEYFLFAKLQEREDKIERQRLERPFDGVPLGLTAPPPQVETLPLGDGAPV